MGGVKGSSQNSIPFIMPQAIARPYQDFGITLESATKLSLRLSDLDHPT
ncbi:hypothetical protein IQ267_14130 [filamentous cyanobacterium LEGE 07170]|nr:hypothetical protein [filamentous cyanobacterium LEGE 07170]